MSKTIKDKSHREHERKFIDGGQRKRQDAFNQREEKRLKNTFRSNNINELLNSVV